jgi:hypothetical protein
MVLHLTANMRLRFASPKLKIKDCAILIGYNKQGKCIYSEVIGIDEYYDGTHIWDECKNVKRIKLYKVKGYLFNLDGILDQEFESFFNLDTGIYKSGRRVFADGTIQKD